MKTRYPHKNRQVSRMLRNNATPEERKLWYDHLKNHPIRFKRQQPIGPYIVDFYCPQASLVIELDGRQHSSDKGKAQDAVRSEYLKTQGLRVMRIKNYQVRETFRSTCERIDLLVYSCIDPDKF